MNIPLAHITTSSNWRVPLSLAATMLYVFIPAALAENGNSAASKPLQKDGLAFPALENYDQFVKDRGRELKKRELQQLAQKRQAELDRIHAMLGTAQTLVEPEKQLHLLLEAEHALSALLAERPERALLRLKSEILRRQREVPAPASFTLSGIPMTLCKSKTGKDAYLSIVPINHDQFGPAVEELRRQGIADTLPAHSGSNATKPVTSISRKTAQAFCKWLSQTSGAPVSLPTPEQLTETISASAIACWTGSEWHDADASDSNQRSRFGIQMATVWDPANHLGAGDLFGELPCARYEKLGFYVATPVETAVEQRILRLRSQQ